MKRIHTRIQLSGVALLLALSGSAFTQDKAVPATKPTAAAPTAPAPAPAAQASTPVPAPISPAAKPVSPPPGPIPAAALVTEAKADVLPKKRVVKPKPKTACTKLDDPWDNLCAIQKNAEVACRDLPTGKKVAKKANKGAVPVTQANKRVQCVNGYMRNV